MHFASQSQLPRVSSDFHQRDVNSLTTKNQSRSRGGAIYKNVTESSILTVL